MTDIDSKIAKQKHRMLIKAKNVTKCRAHVEKLEAQLKDMQQVMILLEEKKKHPEPKKKVGKDLP